MQNTHSHSLRRNPPPLSGPSPTPRLSRSRSGSSSRSLPAPTPRTTASVASSVSGTTPRPIQRSQSTARPASKGKDELNNSISRNPSIALNKHSQQQSFRKSSSNRVLHNDYCNNNEQTTSAKKSKSNGLISPSAWALSPGRFIQSTPSSTSIKLKNFSDGAMNGVLKYFKPKRKVSRMQEDEFHQFRMANNALLQWRFVNARAKLVTSNTKKTAEETLFDVWVRMSLMRNAIVEKRKRVERVRNGMKIMMVLSGQLRLLEEWGKIEAKNIEGVSRLTRKLTGISIRLPLVHGAKGNVKSIYDEMNSAMEVMNDIQQFCTIFLHQLVDVCNFANELKLVLENLQKQSLEELNIWVSRISFLKVKERSLRVNLMQMEQVFRALMNESSLYKHEAIIHVLKKQSSSRLVVM